MAGNRAKRISERDVRDGRPLSHSQLVLELWKSITIGVVLPVTTVRTQSTLLIANEVDTPLRPSNATSCSVR